MKYIIYDKTTGEIIRTGTAPADEVQNQVIFPNEDVLLGEEQNPGQDAVDPVTKTLVPLGRPEPPPPPIDMNYQKARADSYPAVQEQLDMLWHAMDSGATAKIEPFYSTIKAVKQAYPNDNSVIPGSVQIIPMVS